MARGSSNVTTGIKHRGRKLTKDCGPFPGDHTLWPERGRNGSNNSAGDTGHFSVQLWGQETAWHVRDIPGWPTGRGMMVEPIRVLIVDDQPRARKSVRALLSTWNGVLEIREAGNGREAVRLVEELPPDLVLMDARMPEMDGLEATRQIKARWPAVKIVVLSMYVENQDEALAAEADAFVGKGEAPEKLLDVVSAVMQGRV